MNKFANISNSEGLLKIYTGNSSLAEMLRKKLKKMAENRGIEVKDKPEEKVNGTNKR